MPHELHPQHLTTEQCHQRAKLVRNFAKGVTSELLRQDLLDIAAEYERRAESTERGHDNCRITATNNNGSDYHDLIASWYMLDRPHRQPRYWVRIGDSRAGAC